MSRRSISRKSGPIDLVADLPEDDATILRKYAEYANILDGEPEDRIWFGVAQAFDYVGDGRRTLAALERACELNPEWGRYHLELAKAWLRAKQWRRAIQEIGSCAELDCSGCNQSFYAENELYYLGFALFNEGRYKEAAEAWRGADNVVYYWRTPEPLKDFHLNRGWAHHLEGDFLGAIDCYRRGLISPGPGDCSEDDDMDPDAVEEAQKMNSRIQIYYDLARAGETPELADLDPTPYTAN